MSDRNSDAGSPARSDDSDASGKRASRRDKKSRSKSRSASRSKSRSRSRDRRRDRSRSRSRSRSRDRRRRRSRSRSRRRRYSRSRSRDRRGRRGGYRGRDRSTSPYSDRKRHEGDRDAPPESKCLGIFNLSHDSREDDLEEVFGRYGPLANVNIVYDRSSGRSRGFAFITYEHQDDAREARERCSGIEIDGRRVRVDYSITKRPHTPTPGMYMGRPVR